MEEKVKKIASKVLGARYDDLFLLKNKMLARISDEKYIKREWKRFFGTELNLDNPQTICEKIQWLKLYNQKPEYTKMVDKYAVKQYVGDLVGYDHVIPTLGVWERAEDIDFDQLPSQFVLKPTHDSGGLIVCRDKSKLDRKDAIRRLNRSLKHNYFVNNREWVYKNVEPRIIAEPFIDELGNPNSIEYKVTCFDGKVAFVTICQGPAHTDYELRSNDHYTPEFEKLDWYVNYKPAAVPPQKPEQWDELIAFAQKLSAGIPYVRVDTYIIDGKILFGELTFYTWGGFMHFVPQEWDLKLGQMLKLPEQKTMESDN